MNKKISIKNFRVFKDYANFELKPITILTGTNSSGKSSFIKSLKLLQNNIDTNNTNPSNFDKLEFNNQDIYSLGGFNKINSKYSDEKDVYFKMNYNNEFFGELYSEIVFEQNDDSQKDEGILKRHTIYKNNKIIVEINYDKNKRGLYKSYHNKDIWINNFFELLKKVDDIEIIEKICHTLCMRNEISDEEKIIIEDLSKKGFIYHLPDPNSGKNREYGGFYKNENENYTSENIYQLIRILPRRNIFFIFEFCYDILRFQIKNFRNINYNLIEEKDKENVRLLITELLDKGIDSTAKLVNITNEITKNYIRNYLLEGSEVRRYCSVLDQDFDQEGRKLKQIKTFKGSPYYLRSVIDYAKINDDFIQGKLLEEQTVNKLENETNELYYRMNKSRNKINELFKNIIDDVLTDSYDTFYKIKSYPFIGADRSDLQRIFLYNNDSKFMQIINKFLAFKIEKTKSKYAFINKWLKELNIADELIIESDTAGIKIYLLKNNERTLLSDVGYGINMLIPLIISLVSYENSYVFIEEPEANLHPSLQSKLAALFVDAFNQFGTMSVIETHSEYLIRKFQVLISDKKINIKTTDVNIYYLYHPEKIPLEAEQIYLMKIRENGIMENSFGKGFFDESGSLGLDLLNLINLN